MAENHGSHAHHIIPQSKLLQTFVLLLILMAATIGAAVVLPKILGGMGMDTRTIAFIMNIVAITIACWKAFTVIQIFMGVKYTSRLVKLYAWGGFAWFLLMFIAFADYTTRPQEPVPGWEVETASSMPRGTTENPD